MTHRRFLFSLTIFSLLFIFIITPFSTRAAFKIGAPLTTVKNGLVGHWTFDGKDTNWGTNTTNDRSANANHGTITNMSTSTSPTPGRLGQGLRFDGSDDYVDVGTNSVLNTSADMTISAWIKTSDTSVYILTKFVTCANANAIYDFKTESSRLTFRLGNGSTSFTASSTATVTDDAWHHVIGQVEGTTMRVYVDGVIGTNGTFSGTRRSDATKPTRIGNLSLCAGGEFHGSLDDVRIYNRALTTREIKTLYNIGR